jgi:hypothetical protein
LDDLKFKKTLLLKKFAKYFFLGLRERLASYTRESSCPEKRIFSSSNMKFFHFVLFFAWVVVVFHMDPVQRPNDSDQI